MLGGFVTRWGWGWGLVGGDFLDTENGGIGMRIGVGGWLINYIHWTLIYDGKVNKRKVGEIEKNEEMS